VEDLAMGWGERTRRGGRFDYVGRNQHGFFVPKSLSGGRKWRRWGERSKPLQIVTKKQEEKGKDLCRGTKGGPGGQGQIEDCLGHAGIEESIRRGKRQGPGGEV